MIWNVIDERKQRYRWLSVDAVIEDVAHDNSCDDADQAGPDTRSVVYEDRRGISVHDAVTWAEAQPGRVTLYLLDHGSLKS